jgi:hypothetical protein
VSIDTLTDDQLDEMLEMVLPCEIGRIPVIPPQGDCGMPATWYQRMSCDTEGCPDQVVYFCDWHTEAIRRAQALDSDPGGCSWCGTDQLHISWGRLKL